MKEATHCFNEVMFSWIRLFGSSHEFLQVRTVEPLVLLGLETLPFLNSVLLGDPTVQPWWANQPFGMETSTFNVVTWIDLLQISRLGWKNSTRLSILHREFECKKTTMTWKVCAFCAKKGGKLHPKKKRFENLKAEDMMQPLPANSEMLEPKAGSVNSQIHKQNWCGKSMKLTIFFIGDTSSNGLNSSIVTFVFRGEEFNTKPAYFKEFKQYLETTLPVL